MKTCTKCGEQKPVDLFTRDKNRKDGRYPYCKECRKGTDHNAKSRARRWRLEHPEEHAARRDQWASDNWERVKEHKKKSAERHPETRRNVTRRYRAKKRQIQENITKRDIERIKFFSNDECVNCGSTEHLHIDHFRPLSKGNTLSLLNGVVLCRSCNSSKNNKKPEQFFTPRKYRQCILTMSAQYWTQRIDEIIMEVTDVVAV